MDDQAFKGQNNIRRHFHPVFSSFGLNSMDDQSFNDQNNIRQHFHPGFLFS
jgi:hypothetical protein